MSTSEKKRAAGLPGPNGSNESTSPVSVSENSSLGKLRAAIDQLANAGTPWLQAEQKLRVLVGAFAVDITAGNLLIEESRNRFQGGAVSEQPGARANERAAVGGDEGELASVLEALSKFIRRFVVLQSLQADLVALWTVHTHTLTAAEAEFTPYISVTSAEKRSGKTRVLEVLDLLVERPWFTGRTTVAALVRKVHAERPTLLLDESDAAFGGDKVYAEVLRGVLNNGFKRRPGTYSLCVEKGSDHAPTDFFVFCPKAIAGIGRLPDTVEDRSFPIRLKRRSKTEHVEKFRVRKVRPEAERLRDRLACLAPKIAPALQRAEPVVPEELNDRQADIAEVLLAIADLAGVEWATRARRAVLAICGSEVSEDDSTRIRLLRDCRSIFDARKAQALASAELCGELSRLEESGWAEISRGKDITPTTLARLLEPLEIKPRSVRLDSKTTFKGYQRAWFEDAWERYLAPDVLVQGSQAVTPAQPNIDAGSDRFSSRHKEEPVPGPKGEENPINTGTVPGVPGQKVQSKNERLF
jgi:hypothetical protein